jgi:CRP/FNR family transcriptional regulator
VLGATSAHSAPFHGFGAQPKSPNVRRFKTGSTRRCSRNKISLHLDPQYLLQCSCRWHEDADNTAGWELVQAMRSHNRGARALAAELFSQTENGRLLVRDLRRVRTGLREIAVSEDGKVCFKKYRQREASVKTPYGLQMVDDCNDCSLKGNGWYCFLSQNVASALSQASHRTPYPGGAILFVEGQVARGAFILCSGKVKLTTTSKEGKVLIFRVIGPGETIGLSAMISGDAYQMTAETVGPCLVNFVEREALLRLMEQSGELGLRSALAVSRDFQAACRDVHDLILARSSSEKLARLLLSCATHDAPSQGGRIRTPVTHEEMAQRIGASRETVTRLLSSLKKRDLIKLEGATWVIKDRNALEAMAV